MATCPRCSDPDEPAGTAGPLCPEHALAALWGIGRQLATTLSVLRSTADRITRTTTSEVTMG
jgi:hypothetical protein